MNKVKDFWRMQDLVNRLILLSGAAALVWSLIKGSGLYGIVLMVLMLLLMVSRKNNLVKRRSRMYGNMYFPMPDDEVVPLSFEQVCSEYTHGGQSRYNGRRVFLCFPWWGIVSSGDADTGFGLDIRLSDAPELAKEAAAFRRGEPVRVTGRIVAVTARYFVIGELEELCRITEKELDPLPRQ